MGRPGQASAEPGASGADGIAAAAIDAQRIELSKQLPVDLPLLVVALTVATYLPFVSGLGVIPLLLLPPLLLVPPLVWACLSRWCLPAVELTTEGIRKGRRYLRWDELTTIQKGAPGAAPVLLRAAERRARIRLPACRPVFEKVIPAVLARRPDLPVSDRIRRLLDRFQDPRWLTGAVAVALVLSGIYVAVLPALARGHAIWWLLAPALITLLVVSFTAMLALPAPAMKLLPERCFVGHVFAILPLMHLAGGIPLRRLDMVCAATAALYLHTAWIWWRRPQISYARQGIAACMIAVLVGGVYLLPASSITPHSLPHHRDAWRALPFVWSPDGSHGVSWFGHESDDGRKLQHLIRRLGPGEWKLTTLPEHPGSPTTLDVSNRHAVRRVRLKEGDRLYLFDSQTRREVELARAPQIRADPFRCLSPNERAVCWTESHTTKPAASTTRPSPAPPVLKVHDLKTGRTQPIAVDFPDIAGVEWSGCGWAADDILVVSGGAVRACHEPREPEPIHLLRVQIPGGAPEYVTTVRRFRNYRLSPDYAKAFVVDDAGRISFMDLASRETLPLIGDILPAWHPNGTCAFRLVDLGTEGKRLCRFDVSKREEATLLIIPEELDFVSLSPNGSFAVLTHAFGRISPGVLVDLNARRRRRIDVSMLSLWSSREVHLMRPTSWSADESVFFTPLTQFLQEPHLTLGVCRVPPDWLPTVTSGEIRGRPTIE